MQVSDFNFKAMGYFQESKLVDWLVEETKIVKNEKQAQLLVLGFVVAAVLASFVFLGQLFSKNSTVKQTDYQSSQGYGGERLPDDYR